MGHVEAGFSADALEAQAFAENSFANMDHVFTHGIFEASTLGRAAWRTLLWLGTLAPQKTQASADSQYARPEMAAA